MQVEPQNFMVVGLRIIPVGSLYLCFSAQCVLCAESSVQCVVSVCCAVCSVVIRYAICSVK